MTINSVVPPPRQHAWRRGGRRRAAVVRARRGRECTGLPAGRPSTLLGLLGGLAGQQWTSGGQWLAALLVGDDVGGSDCRHRRYLRPIRRRHRGRPAGRLRGRFEFGTQLGGRGSWRGERNRGGLPPHGMRLKEALGQASRILVLRSMWEFLGLPDVR